MHGSSLAGKVFVVTGSTQGLGEAIARRFAQGGAAGLVISGRNAAKGERVAAEISAAGTRTVFIEADLAELEQTRAIMTGAHSIFGRLDGLVNAAGLTERANILETTPQFLDRMMAINFTAPFFLMQDAIRQMRACGSRGTIVNILSMSIHGGSPLLPAYSASKAALASATRNTAYAMLPDRIRINGIALGWMNTPAEDAIQRRFHDRSDGWVDKVRETQPFGRLIEPAEVAETVAFLSCGLSGLMTGSIVDFDQRVVGCQIAFPEPPPALRDPLS